MGFQLWISNNKLWTVKKCHGFRFLRTVRRIWLLSSVAAHIHSHSGQNPTNQPYGKKSSQINVMHDRALRNYNEGQKCWDTLLWNSIFKRLEESPHLTPFSLLPERCWIFYYCTDHSTHTTLNRPRSISRVLSIMPKWPVMQRPVQISEENGTTFSEAERSKKKDSF